MLYPRLAAAIACLLAAAAPLHARRVVENWDITYVTTNRGLPQLPKRGVGVNGAFPLPVVEAELGDTLVLNVRNSLDVPTSLHAHGILQQGTPYYDGVPMVSSCPIAPGTNFTYEIPLYQSGTYWIHGHAKEQNYDGLRTPLIVRDPKDPYRTDGEFLFAVEDWWPTTIDQAVKMLQVPGIPVPPFINPPQTLVNGYWGRLARPMQFTPGKTYRIRLVSMMSLPLWEFVVDNHTLTVVEVDGVNIKPFKTDVMRMAPAQRTTVLVTAKESISTNYQYHITVLDDYVPPIPGVYPAQYDGSVVYSQNAQTSIAASIPSGPLDDLLLQSLEDEPVLIPDRSVFLNITAGYIPIGSLSETVDLITYRDPLVPSLLSALTSGERAINPITYGPQTNARVFRLDEVVEVLFWSATSLPHVMHTHGYNFQVVETGLVNDTTGQFTRRVPPTGFTPLRRDSVFVPQGAYVVVRFKASNPGAWIVHCHFDWHMAMGMNSLFVVAPRAIQQSITLPPSVAEQCRQQGVKTSGNAAGNNAYDYAGAPELPYILASPPGIPTPQH
ncbi:ferroxidase fet3 [Coemansia spiralis]|nr:ferroxidase fet3 [Coemansia spiralis]